MLNTETGPEAETEQKQRTESERDTETEQQTDADTPSETVEHSTIPVPSDLRDYFANIRVYANSLNGGDMRTRPYEGPEINRTVMEKKDDMPKASFSVPGNAGEGYYEYTLRDPASGMICDCYAKSIVFFDIDTATGKLVRFVDSDTLHMNKSPADVLSASLPDEDAVIAYAASVLSECAGFDADGWEVELATVYPRDSYYETSYSGFIPAGEAPEGQLVRYKVTFFKTINGIRRSDSPYVVLSDKGALLELLAQPNDRFNLFSDARFDGVTVASAFDLAFQNIDCLSYTNQTELVTDGERLFAMSTYDYKYLEETGMEFGAGVEYIMQLAGPPVEVNPNEAYTGYR